MSIDKRKFRKLIPELFLFFFYAESLSPLDGGEVFLRLANPAPAANSIKLRPPSNGTPAGGIPPPPRPPGIPPPPENCAFAILLIKNITASIVITLIAFFFSAKSHFP